MKVYRLFALAALFASLSLVPSCNPVNPDNPGGGGGGQQELPVDQINGTTIADGMNACGLVSDAATGKGIAGVPVTDGYTYVVTDANGVYQMAANRYTRNIYISVPSEYKLAPAE